MLLLLLPQAALPVVDTYVFPVGGSRVVCDRCGFRCKPRSVRKEWSGLIVCRRCYDPRPAETHPPRIKPEGLPLRDTRPEPAPVFREEGAFGGDDL